MLLEGSRQAQGGKGVGNRRLSPPSAIPSRRVVVARAGDGGIMAVFPPAAPPDGVMPAMIPEGAAIERPDNPSDGVIPVTRAPCCRLTPSCRHGSRRWDALRGLFSAIGSNRIRHPGRAVRGCARGARGYPQLSATPGSIPPESRHQEGYPVRTGRDPPSGLPAKAQKVISKGNPAMMTPPEPLPRHRMVWPEAKKRGYPHIPPCVALSRQTTRVFKAHPAIGLHPALESPALIPT